MPVARKPYPSDVTDEEWSLVVAYLTLMREDAQQRQHSLRELFNGLRYVIRYGIALLARRLGRFVTGISLIDVGKRGGLAGGVLDGLGETT
jgi:hypothetical protein